MLHFFIFSYRQKCPKVNMDLLKISILRVFHKFVKNLLTKDQRLTSFQGDPKMSYLFNVDSLLLVSQNCEINIKAHINAVRLTKWHSISILPWCCKLKFGLIFNEVEGSRSQIDFICQRWSD